MKQLFVFILFVALNNISFSQDSIKIQWLSVEEAELASAKEPRPWFIDTYTDWCYWCKVMDSKTFTNKEVIEYVHKNFYAVKLNAESKQDIVYNKETYKWVEFIGRNGAHQLAYLFVDGQLLFPTIIFLSNKNKKIKVSPGFKTPELFLKQLQFVKEEKFLQKENIFPE